MLPPSRQSWSAKKAEYAGSIWSFDSGYGTGDAAEGSSTKTPAHAIGNDNFYLQASTSANSLQGRLNASEVEVGLGSNTLYTDQQQHSLPTVPAVAFTGTQESPTLVAQPGAEYLPDISQEDDCLSCDLWNLTNPGPTRKCESCQLTASQTIEPNLLNMHSTSGEHRAPFLRVFPALTLEATPNALPSSTQTRCSACELSAIIDPSGPTSCSSCSPWSPESSQSPKHLSPTSQKPKKCKVRRSHAGRNTKLPLAALNRLQSWLGQHQENPYPSALEKKQLAVECGITEKQVATWFTNARARQLSPLDSYLASASEEELAMESDIASAAQTPPYTSGFAGLSTAAPYTGRAGSISGSSAFSTSTRTQPSRRGKKKDYRKKKEPLPQIPQWIPSDPDTAQAHAENTEQELWQCTFCLAPLVPKSWRRHEETQHRPRSKWTCMLYGPRVSVPNRSLDAPSSVCCAFCMAKDPSAEHFLHNHRIVECSKRPMAERTFLRPDHLRQHVRNFHGAGLHEVVQLRWKRGSEGKESDEGEGWQCGFCGDTLRDWGVREAHIAGHFKDGMRMSMWRTNWGNGGSSQQQSTAIRHESRDKGKEKESGKEKEHGFAKLTRTLSRLSTSTRASLSRSNTLKHSSLSRASTLKFGALSRSNTIRMLTRSPRQSGEFATEMATTSAVVAPTLPEQPSMCSGVAQQGMESGTFLPQINMDPLMEEFGAFANGAENDPGQLEWNHFPVLQNAAYETGMHFAEHEVSPSFAYVNGTSFQQSHEASSVMMDGLGDEWMGNLDGWQSHWGWGQQ